MALALARRARRVTPLVPVILAGGAGSRLWPVSRAACPKPFQPLFDGESLLQHTLRRAAWVTDEPPMVICGEAHRFLAVEQVCALGPALRQLVLEPDGRGTAAAIALAAHLVRAECAEAQLLIMPADHWIGDWGGFAAAVAAAAEAADGAGGPIVAFGIAPSRAETGYGYIEAAPGGAGAVSAVSAFVEKPDKATARGFLASGRHLWNSGMFLMPVKTCLAEIAAHQPETAAAVAASVEDATAEFDFLRPGPAFLDSPKGSFDTVVMENTDNAVVLPVAFAWRDIGAWDEVLAASRRDGRGNHIEGDVLARDVCNSLIESRGRLVAALGVDGLVIVETADAVLVTRRDRAQEVRALAAELERAGRPEYLADRRVYRPWGSYECVDRGEGFQVKRLRVRPGASISLQLHEHRAEHWVVVRGVAEVTRGDRTIVLGENESVYIPRGVMHRLHNPGEETLEVIEIQVGYYLGEDDIIRFEDAYGRTLGHG